LFLNPAGSVSFPGSQPPVRIDLYPVKPFAVPSPR